MLFKAFKWQNIASKKGKIGSSKAKVPFFPECTSHSGSIRCPK